jgi:AraC family mar-sox-rob regulon transcriptional activator
MNDAPAGSADPSQNSNARVSLEHITDWESLVVEARYSPRELCARCGFSMRHVQRVVLKKFNMNLGWFVSAVRMMKAYNLLKSGFTVKETALGLGFKQVSHFCRCFKRHFHANPSAVLLNSGLPGRDGHASDPQLELEFFRPYGPPRLEPKAKPTKTKRRKPASARKKREP